MRPRIKSGPVLHSEAAEFLYHRDGLIITLSFEVAGARPHIVLSVKHFLLIGICRSSSWSVPWPMMLRLIAVLMVIVILSEIENEINGKVSGSIVMCSQGLHTRWCVPFGCCETVVKGFDLFQIQV